MVSLPVTLPPNLTLSHDQFERIAIANPALRLELTAEGSLITMPPTGSESGNHNAEIASDLVIWNRRHKLGKCFDSSTGFRLPNGAVRSPDVSWVSRDRWEALTPQQRRGFAPLCPDFVLELASPTDDREPLRSKMQEYLANGCRLGWLIDPSDRQVEIYRPAQPPERLNRPTTLDGETVLVGLILDLAAILDATP